MSNKRSADKIELLPPYFCLSSHFVYRQSPDCHQPDTEGESKEILQGESSGSSRIFKIAACLFTHVSAALYLGFSCGLLVWDDTYQAEVCWCIHKSLPKDWDLITRKFQKAPTVVTDRNTSYDQNHLSVLCLYHSNGRSSLGYRWGWGERCGGGETKHCLLITLKMKPILMQKKVKV